MTVIKDIELLVAITPILELYDAGIAKGKKFQHLYEVTAGAVVADKLGLDIGSTFFSSHGLNDDEDLEHEHGLFQVVGILKATGSGHRSTPAYKY